MSKAKEPKRGRPKGPATKSATFRLPEEILRMLAQVAQQQERAQTVILRRALERYFAEASDED